MKNFIKTVFRQTLALVVSALFAIALLAVASIAILSAVGRKMAIRVPQQAVLVIDMASEFPDAPVDAGILGPFLTNGELGARIPSSSVILAINEAADDDRIKAILLLGAGPDLPETGLTTIAEIRRALDDFRESGKPVYAYVGDTGMRDYALASAADKVWMHPMCSFGIEGFSIERLYFGEAFGKYGIGVQTASCGRYKSAPDTFAMDHMRPEDREQMQAFLADAWSAWTAMVSESRNVPADALEALSKEKGVLNTDEAVEAKLVDRVAYRDELDDELRTLVGANDENSSFSQIDLRDYLLEETHSIDLEQPKNLVAVEYIEGEIVDGDGCWEEAGADRIVRDLQSLRSDKSVKAVVLRVNSPGGGAIASEKIRREVQLLAADRPVVVSMGRMAASGGYWVSAPANRIFAEPSTLTGSIGVFSLFIDVEKLSNDLGVHSDTVTTAPYADMYSIFQKRDERQMELARRSVDGIYDRFLLVVSSGRGMDREAVAKIAEGRIWSGTAAVKLGLADSIGSLDDAIAAAAEMAGISSDYDVEDIPVTLTFADKLHELMSTRAHSAGRLSVLPEKLKAAVNSIEKTHVFARLPFLV
ncbi:MAG TPA: signal peptide peptidase SppA, partial [Opitutales bacterium]|nr:signal peptide peptidase SppA [Opitutales bacterium]